MLDVPWSNDPSPASSSRPTQPTPANPPNSPTPSASPMQALMKKRKDQSLLSGRRSDLVQYPSSYYNLPLVLRNRFTLGRKPKGDDGMSIEGKSLHRRGDTGGYRYPSTLYFTRESPKASGYKSSYHGVRESLGKRFQELHFPSLATSGKKKETPPALGKFGDSPSPLHSCLASPSHQQKEQNKQEYSTPPCPDSKRHLGSLPNLEYINLVQQVVPGSTTPKPPGNCTFDTKKLFINWSLEKIRKARGRGKTKGKKKLSPEELLKKLETQETDKDYVLGKFLADQSETSRARSIRTPDQCPLHSIKDIQCDQCRREITEQSPGHLPPVTNHNDIRKLRFATLPQNQKQTLPTSSETLPPGFADTISDFKNGCFKSTRSFIIRKEQITTSRTFLTVTSLTINKIPQDGFMTWQYKTDESLLEKP